MSATDDELRRLAEDAEPHHPLWPFCGAILTLLDRLRGAEEREACLRGALDEIRSLPDPERIMPSSVENWSSYEAAIRATAKVAAKALRAAGKIKP
jgi:hypothetical protein